MASAGARSYNGGLGAEPPVGSRGRAPGGGGGQSPLKLKALGRAPSGVQGLCPGALPLVVGGGVRGRPLKLRGRPPEAESSLAFGRPSDEANLHHFRNFAKSENHIYFLSYIPTGLPQDYFFQPRGSSAAFVCIPAGTP